MNRYSFFCRFCFAFLGLVALGKSHAQHEGPGIAFGRLISFPLLAESFKNKCAPEADANVIAEFSNWTKRNEPILNKLEGIGSEVIWSRKDNPELVDWGQVKLQAKSYIEERVNDRIKGNLLAACEDAAKKFASGQFDLTQFPDDLAAVGIQIR